MLCALYTGLWGLMRGFVYAREIGICYVHYIKGCGAS